MNLKNLSSNVKIKTEKIKTMNINSNTSVEVYPGSIDLKSFSSSNIILPNWETGAYSAPYQYVLPDGSTLLQTFSGLNRSGQPYTKVGDIWFKNYISLLPDKTYIEFLLKITSWSKKSTIPVMISPSSGEMSMKFKIGTCPG